MQSAKYGFVVVGYECDFIRLNISGFKKGVMVKWDFSCKGLFVLDEKTCSSRVVTMNGSGTCSECLSILEIVVI